MHVGIVPPVLYVPARHREQSFPLMNLYPPLHVLQFPFVLSYVAHVLVDLVQVDAPFCEYVFLVHDLHVVAVFPELYVPALHSLHAPLTSMCPLLHVRHLPVVLEHVAQLLSHVMHVDNDEAPTVVENVPFGHFVQSVDAVVPCFELYVPAGQLTHDSPPSTSEYFPVGHLVHDELPSFAEYVPLGHIVQDVAPSPLYVPGLQLSHDCFDVAFSLSENVPAGHFLHADEPAPLYVPFSQPLHIVDDFAPVTLLYVPAEHWSHDALPSVSAYVPAGLVLHLDVPPVPYVPLLHFLHSPLVSSYPSGHSIHLPVVLTQFLHDAHCIHEEDPSWLAYVLVPHLLQVAVPPLLYVPLGHILHILVLVSYEYPSVQFVHFPVDASQDWHPVHG